MISYDFPNVDAALPVLCGDLLRDGALVGSRLGEQVREFTHVALTLEQPLDREVLIAHRNADIVAQIAESMWILAGRNDIGWLSNYLPRAADFSDDGITWRGGYGPRIRKWTGTLSHPVVDQLKHVVDVLRADPDSRRAVIAIYDAALDTQPGKDIPCNDFINFVLRDGWLSAHVYIRSNDVVWGWSGINAFEWSVLLEVVAALVGAEVGPLHFSIGSLHIYDRHFDRADRIAKAPRIIRGFAPAPRIQPSLDSVDHLDILIKRWFDIEAAARAGQHIADVDFGGLEQPLFEAFARVICWHWSGDAKYLKPLWGTALAEACSAKEQRRRAANPPLPEAPTFVAGAFDRMVADLHAEKHAAYGDSWKKRGESFSILPNIFRKADRLASGTATSDESQVDTAIDLLVYLIKYRWFLTDNLPIPAPVGTTDPTDEVQRVADVLAYLPKGAQVMNEERLVSDILAVLDSLEEAVANQEDERWRIVETLIGEVNLLARHRVWKQGNAARRWEPQETPEKVGAKGWPYQPTQPQREPHTDA